ncbi:hypothetical protein [Rhizobium leguminosarum]|uniref:hypothetical protein n=1 Tax=Rhizobium leguminosarum TaxID=384 RepID=UPI001319CBF9|nr:hypothetical protein [Rhizobium leguminosarum]
MSESEYVRLSPAERGGHTLRRMMHVAAGRLKLIAYSPVFSDDWRLEWTETPSSALERRLDTIIDDIEAAARNFDRDAGPT